MTKKLYYDNAYIREFSATVLEVIPKPPYYLTVLDKTAFFPEEGGQSADHGMIGDYRVVDVREKDGAIYHVTENAPNVGDTYNCYIDFDERYDKMKQHTAEHILSGIIKRLFGFDNVGFHLGYDIVTMDTDGPLSDDDLVLIETLANKAVSDNLEVVAYFPTSDELSTLEYRSKLDLKENVRIVRIGEVDICACCAPHVAMTGEIGEIKILEAIKWKNGMRISIAAGERALADHREKSDSVKGISVLLSAPKSEVLSAVMSLKDSYDEAKRKCRELELKIANLEASHIQPTDGNLVSYFEGMNVESLIAFSNVARQKVGGILVALGGVDGDFKYVISSDKYDVRSMSKDINSALNGRGGGNSGMIQGSFKASLDDIKAYFE